MNSAHAKSKKIRRRAGRLLAYTTLTALASASATTVTAQTWNEWFRQKSTQKKYLINQIAALQVYIGYAKKGYEVVSGGIHTVRDIKNGEFGMHSAFFGSLKTVSPFIRDNAKVAEILAMQLAISKALGESRHHALLSEDSRTYIDDVRENVLAECAKDLEELLLAVTSDKVEMTEDQRLQRLDKVHESMTDRSAFVRHFTAQVRTLIAQKEREQKQNENLKKIYGYEEND